jgi:hypothetical protein
MTWVATAVVGSSLVGGYLNRQSQTDAANTAATAQTNASNAAISEQRNQFAAMQQMLSPYVQAGQGALLGQQNLAGLNGQQAQQSAISGIQNGAQFQALQRQGNDAILQNASATGGLRGGNTQGALAQFSPQLLNQMIQQQYSQLGGLASMGQNSAAMQGQSGLQTAGAIGQQYGQIGAAQAGNALAAGQAQSQFVNGITGSVGTLAGMYGSGSWGGLGSSGPVNSPVVGPSSTQLGGF